MTCSQNVKISNSLAFKKQRISTYVGSGSEEILGKSFAAHFIDITTFEI